MWWQRICGFEAFESFQTFYKIRKRIKWKFSSNQDSKLVARKLKTAFDAHQDTVADLQYFFYNFLLGKTRFAQNMQPHTRKGGERKSDQLSDNEFLLQLMMLFHARASRRCAELLQIDAAGFLPSTMPNTFQLQGLSTRRGRCWIFTV